MGGDGKSGSQVAKDAFGFALHYFDPRDYAAVSAAVKPFAAAVGNSPLFNGNISAISQSISTLGTLLLYRYNYDVLNRYVGMVAASGLDTLQNSWTSGFGSIQEFKELLSYDRNGNILTYIRNGNKTFAGSPIGMDSLTYHYRPGTNKLSYVTDLVKGGNYGNDIDNQQVDNYKYDSIGNMASDVRSGVDSIKWNLYGKVARIYKHDTTAIIYTYDAAGNRISKSFISKAKDTLQTFYVRDATGNILSTYAYRDTSVNNGKLSQIEANLYGSSRLGMTTLATNVQDPTQASGTSMIGLGYGENITFTRGKKFFELTNHLGNVRATVSDRKIGVSVNNTTIDSYNPVINSAQEYYPFGMLMPGRGGHIGVGKNIVNSTVIMGGDTIPATLTVNQRTGNTPGVYKATEVISFEDGFSSAVGDTFTTVFVNQTSADPGTESGVSYGIDAKGYRYGFNGKENDNEVVGEGNQLDFGARIYDPRIGKFFSVDPMSQSSPNLSSYQYASNSPVILVDVEGMFGDPATNKPARGSGLKKVESAKIVRMTTQVKPGDVPWYLKLIKWGGRIGGTIGLVFTPMPATPLHPEMKGDETWYIKHPKSNFHEDENPGGVSNAFDYKARVVSDANKKPEDKNGTITLYRGVSRWQVNTPLQYTLARRGIAAPIGYISDLQDGIIPMFITGHEDAFDHTGGDVASIWTSWTTDRNIAVNFANNKSKGFSSGVVLTKVFKKSDLTVPTLNLGEKEWLVPGIVTGAKVEYVDGYGNTVPSEPQPPARTNK